MDLIFSPRSTGIVHPRLRFEPFNLMVSASHWMLFVARELKRGEDETVLFSG